MKSKVFSADRYDRMAYRRSGRSGLKLPAVSLGAWMTFGGENPQDAAQKILFRAFDLGINHFDLANNYGKPPGSSERIVGKILKAMPRDELVIATKAGHGMWPGPYGSTTSKKGLVASLDQSLKRLGLEYVDLFYAHRWLEEVSAEEVVEALDLIVRQGKALYAGISKWPVAHVDEAAEIVRSKGRAPVVLHQICYNLLWRNHGQVQDWLPQASKLGMGVIVFSPLANGLLSGRYSGGKIPKGARANLWSEEWRKRHFSDQNLGKIAALGEIARERGESLSVMALAWLLQDSRVTSVLIGASRVSQLEENVRALKSPAFTPEQLSRIDRITL